MVHLQSRVLIQENWRDSRDYCLTHGLQLAQVYGGSQMTEIKRVRESHETWYDTWIGLTNVSLSFSKRPLATDQRAGVFGYRRALSGEDVTMKNQRKHKKIFKNLSIFCCRKIVRFLKIFLCFL